MKANRISKTSGGKKSKTTVWSVTYVANISSSGYVYNRSKVFNTREEVLDYLNSGGCRTVKMSMNGDVIYAFFGDNISKPDFLVFKSTLSTKHESK